MGLNVASAGLTSGRRGEVTHTPKPEPQTTKPWHTCTLCRCAMPGMSLHVASAVLTSGRRGEVTHTPHPTPQTHTPNPKP